MRDLGVGSGDAESAHAFPLGNSFVLVGLALAASPGHLRQVKHLHGHQLQSTASDPTLVNGWGLAALAGSPWWVADNGTDVVDALQRRDGAKTADVTVAGRADRDRRERAAPGSPSRRRRLRRGAVHLRHRGRHDPRLEPGGRRPTHGDRRRRPDHAGAIYKGLAIATADGAAPLRDRLPQRPRRRLRRPFSPSAWPGAFIDPKLPAGYAPFGIQTINGMIFVTYAKQDAEREDEVAGQGLGFVDAYDTDGSSSAASRRAAQLERAVGPRAGRRRRLRPLQRRPAGRQLRRRRDQRVRAAARRQLASSTASCAAADHKAIVDRRALGARVRERPREQRPDDHALLHGGPERREHGLFGTITAG